MNGGARRHAVRVPSAMAAVSACLALILTGCGSGGTPPNQGDNALSDVGSPSPGMSPGDSTTQDGEYRWYLPPTNTGVDAGESGGEGPVYVMLQENCDSAEQQITQEYERFQSPRNALLYTAGVHLCHGDHEQARVYYDHARWEYGLDGLGPEGSPKCELYRSVASALEQAPRDNFPCPGGAAPPHRHGPEGTDNPFDFDGAQNPGDRTTENNTSPSSGNPGSTDKKYPWYLPTSDTSINQEPRLGDDGFAHTSQGSDGYVYQILRETRCQSAEENVTQEWYKMQSPRNVILFMAGVHLCYWEAAQASGDREGQGHYKKAEGYYNRVLKEYGLAGLGGKGPYGPILARCDLYKSVESVLEGKPRDDSDTCEHLGDSSKAPPWPACRRTGDSYALILDNPFTKVDESKGPDCRTPEEANTENPDTASEDQGETTPTPTSQTNVTDESDTPGP